MSGRSARMRRPASLAARRGSMRSRVSPASDSRSVKTWGRSSGSAEAARGAERRATGSSRSEGSEASMGDLLRC